MQPLPIRRKWILHFIIIVVALSLATPALADYLGPDRTVTETTGVCKIVLNECQFVTAKNEWRYKTVEDWVCSNESKPWQAYPGTSRPCNDTQHDDGYQYWSREDDLQTVTVTYPPATINGSLQNCSLQNGWCGSTIPQLLLNGNEPLSGQSILLIEGTLNGQPFACPAGVATCNVPLLEGDNSFTYWALSSWGDSSTMGASTAKVDTISPDVSLSLNGASGTNGWYISPVTVTAEGSDATSGLASALLSVNSGDWQPSATLPEGRYDIAVTASDNAGNSSSASTTISVDTTTPAISVVIDGTAGQNGWYRSAIQVSASVGDATSGVDSFEVSADGGGYQSYTSAISFGDGSHTIQFKAIDNAGNTTETPLQRFLVDTIAPTVDLPVSWELGRNVPYDVQDDGSGLAALRLVIEDEDERYAKVAWDETVSGAAYSQDINWNGEFKDKTVAPPGTYLVWIKARDTAGNERIRLGKVIVPEPNLFFNVLQSNSESTEQTPVPPADLLQEDISSMPPAAPALDFGGSATDAEEESTQSVLLATGTAGSVPATASDVLWGAAAAAAIGAATAYALEERRKREEAEARQAAEARAEMEEDVNRRAEKLQKQQENWAKKQALEEAQREAANSHAIDAKISRLEMEEELVKRARELEKVQRMNFRQDQRADSKDEAVQNEMNTFFSAKPEDWRPAYNSYMAQKEMEKFLQQEEIADKNVNPKDRPWWQKALDDLKGTADRVVGWIDQHQVEIAIGIGIVVGVGAIVITGGLASPLVAAAIVAGSALAAGTGVGLMTVGLNIYQGRDWHENLARNALLAGGVAAAITGAVFTFNTLAIRGTAYCMTNPAVCAMATPGLKMIDTASQIIDTGEAFYLTTKLGYQTWRGDQAGAQETAIDLYSEYIDGGVPGNFALKELRDEFGNLNKDAIYLIKNYGADVIPLIERHGDEGLQIIWTYGDEGVDFLRLYGDDAIALLKAYGADAFKLTSRLNALVGPDAVKDAVKQGPDAVIALTHWSDDELRKYGDELVDRVSTDAVALDAAHKLAKMEDLDSPEAKALARIAAINFMQGNGDRMILGKWFAGDFDKGFIGVARAEDALYYGPSPGLEEVFKKLSPEDRDRYLWAVNQAALQVAVDSGWTIDYSLDGVEPDFVEKEIQAINAIASRNLDEVTRIYGRFPFRMKEIEFLVKQGYTFKVDVSTNVVHLVKP